MKLNDRNYENYKVEIYYLTKNASIIKKYITTMYIQSNLLYKKLQEYQIPP